MDNNIKLAQPSTSLDPAKIVSNIDTAIANVGGILSNVLSGALLVQGDIAGAAGVFAAKFLAERSNIQQGLSQVLGLSAPRNEKDETEAANAEASFKAILNLEEYQEYERADKYFDYLKDQINKSEDELRNLAFTNLQTSTGGPSGAESEKFYFTDAGKIQEAHKKHKQLLQSTLNFAVAFSRRIKELMARDEYKAKYQIYRGPVEAYLRLHDNYVADLKNKVASFASLALIAKNIQQKKRFIDILRKNLPEIEKWMGAGVDISTIIRNPGGVLEQLRTIINEQREAMKTIFSEIQKMDTLMSTPATTLPGVGTLAVSERPSPTTSPTSSLSQPAKPKIELAPTPEEWYKESSANIIRFSNLIVEPKNQDNTRIAQVNPDKLNHYRAKMKDYLTDKARFNNLRTYIWEKDPSLTPQEKTILLNEMNALTGTQQVLGLSNIAGQIIPPTSTGLISGGSLGTQLGTSITPSTPTTPSTGTSTPSGTGGTTVPATVSGLGSTVAPGRSGVGYTGSMPSEAAMMSAREMESQMSELPFVKNVLLTPGDAEVNPKAYRDSLDFQMRELNANLQKLQGAYQQLVLQPSGGVQGLYNLAHTNSKFIKTADKEDEEEIVEADQRFKDYWDKELGYGPWGTMIEEKPKHHDKTYEEEKELHPSRVSKFRKI